MEPLSIIALAGNILQFVEVITKLTSSSRQVSLHGATEENIQLGTIAEEIKKLISRVNQTRTDGGELSSEQKPILLLGQECDRVAQELLDVLETVKLKNADGKDHYVRSFYKVLLAEWKKPKIDALEERLHKIGSSIQTHLVAYDSDKIMYRLDELSRQNRLLRAHRDDEIQQLRKQVSSAFQDIGEKMRAEDSRNHTMAALLKAAASGSRYSAEQMILVQLGWDEMNYRFQSIPNPHENSYSWLFGSGEQRSPASFDEWLSSDEDLFWISGKPGSGKSTLMKFLCDDQKTTDKLNLWAQRRRLLKAGFFFWDAGKRLQKSHEGLLRSLLFDILRTCPDLIPVAYPKVWELYFPSDGEVSPGSMRKGPTVGISLAVDSLLDTLKDVCADASSSETRFCIFIDGLDEYEGKPNDVIELVCVLRHLPNMKLCVSSRPWNEFELEFSKNSLRVLYMQDFNSTDISAYVRDTFAQDDNYQDLEDREVNGEPLIEEIVQNANGVFFWVFLVVQSFKEGLQNGDSAADLRERLGKLPKDLNEYFDRIILSDVDEFYHRNSAEMFSVTVEGEEAIPLLAYWFIKEGLNYVLGLEANPLSMQQVNKRLQDTAKRLNAACKGLLEVRYLSSSAQEEEESALPASILFQRKVGFLHRTVREYLQLEETQAILRTWASDGFDAHATICIMLLAQLKVSPDDPEYWVENGPMAALNTTLLDHYIKMSGSVKEHIGAQLMEDLHGLLEGRDAPFRQINDTSAENVQESGGGSESRLDEGGMRKMFKRFRHGWRKS